MAFPKAFYKVLPLKAKPGTAGNGSVLEAEVPLGLPGPAPSLASILLLTRKSHGKWKQFFFSAEILLRTPLFGDCMQAFGLKTCVPSPDSLEKDVHFPVLGS